jgi:hypothetical protein
VGYITTENPVPVMESTILLLHVTLVMFHCVWLIVVTDLTHNFGKGSRSA